MAVKAPKKLESTFAAPTARKSALISVSKPPIAAEVRVVADVWAIQIMEIASAVPIVSSMESNVSGGSVRLGRPDFNGPRVLTPRALKSKIAEVAMASTSTTSAPGNRPPMRENPSSRAKDATPTIRVGRLKSDTF